MQHSLLISDLHLGVDRQDLAATLTAFLAGPAAQARQLFVLGDLFEFWVGDDALEEGFAAAVATAFRRLSDQGVPVHLMHGNRDFLLGEAFLASAGMRLLSDPTVLDLHGVPTLLMHGDTLCTDDVAYQAFRRHVRDPEVQGQFLAQPLEARRRQVGEVRATSEREKQAKSVEIMDVSQSAVEAVLREHGYPRLIHGHTHRPARHEHHLDAHLCERWVLSDWDTGPEALRVDETGCTRIRL